MLLWVHLISQFLMWMDEGYYDFRWMSDGWNWVIYFVYTSLIYVLSFGAYLLLFRKSDQFASWKILTSATTGFGVFGVILTALYINMR